jgi:hypothetical protein
VEVQDVANLRTAEAVDRLRIVAHHRKISVPGDVRAPAPLGLVAASADEQLQQPVLRVVGVLVLVHEYVAERRRVALAHLSEQLEQVDRPEQQVVEVHRVHPMQVALVDLIHIGDHLLERRAGRCPAVGG